MAGIRDWRGRRSLCSKLDRLIHLPALGAARSIDIGVVGVNITTASTAKNAILGGGRFETTASKLSIDSHPGQAGHGDNHVSENEIMNRHVSSGYLLRHRRAEVKCAIQRSFAPKPAGPLRTCFLDEWTEAEIDFGLPLPKQIGPPLLRRW